MTTKPIKVALSTSKTLQVAKTVSVAQAIETLSFLIAGQSNAVGYGGLVDSELPSDNVFLFGNDYEYKMASEPIDNKVNQIDTVSLDSNPGNSFALRMGKGLSTYRVLLIPCAMGGTSPINWTPTVNRLDRSTLYGSANYRRSLVSPLGLTALLYYGHESESNTQERTDNYINTWTALINEFRQDYGDIPIIYCQLAKHANETIMSRFNQIAEKQRLMESGQVGGLENHYMAVTFDLPLSDTIHLSVAGQKALGDRIALIIREKILKENINGTGARLVSLTHPNEEKNKIEILTNHDLNIISNNADNQFRVYDDGVEITIQSVVRSTNTKAILITTNTTPSGTVTVDYGNVLTSTGITYSNAVKDTDDLPLPQFGKLTVI